MSRFPTDSRPRAALAPEGDASGAGGKPDPGNGVPAPGDEDGGLVGRGGRERKAFLLRVSPEVMEELRGWASAEFRSLNSHIEYLLRDALRRRRGKKE